MIKLLTFSSTSVAMTWTPDSGRHQTDRPTTTRQTFDWSLVDITWEDAEDTVFHISFCHQAAARCAL